MIRSNNPLFRSTEISATPSGTPRIGSGIGTATTVSPSPRRSVIVDEQRSQSQKYSALRSLMVQGGHTVFGLGIDGTLLVVVFGLLVLLTARLYPNVVG
jgi:hypothetical protein